MKKLLIVSLVLMMVFSLTACTKGDPEPDLEDDVDVSAESPKEEPLKVAAILSGPINDMGWNASAHEGLLMLEEEFGCEISFMESIARSDYEETFRNYASSGYDVIFGHGFEFGDPAILVAEEFPDTQFVIISSDISNGVNLGSTTTKNTDQGFIAGALAALLTESNIVAGIGGMDIPPIRENIVGFRSGAKYINPDIKVTQIMTGSNEDVAGLKETAKAMINEGADVLFNNADQAGLGGIEACEEEGIWAIGSNQDQNVLAPDTVFQSVIKSTPHLFKHIIGLMQDGTYEAKFHGLGVKEGAIYLADWHGYDEEYPEIAEKLDEIMKGLGDGSIVYDPAESSF